MFHDWDYIHEICRRCGVTAIDQVEGIADQFCEAQENVISIDYRRMKKLSDAVIGAVLGRMR